jgi:hypothetical protein
VLQKSGWKLKSDYSRDSNSVHLLAPQCSISTGSYLQCDLTAQDKSANHTQRDDTPAGKVLPGVASLDIMFDLCEKQQQACMPPALSGTIQSSGLEQAELAYLAARAQVLSPFVRLQMDTLHYAGVHAVMLPLHEWRSISRSRRLAYLRMLATPLN